MLITTVVLFASLFLVYFVGDRKAVDETCLAKQYFKPEMQGSYCYVGLTEIANLMKGYHSEFGEWAKDMETLNYENVSEAPYEYEILFRDQYGYIAACYSNLDDDGRRDIWIVGNTNKMVQHISNDCSDDGRMSGLENWRDELKGMLKGQ